MFQALHPAHPGITAADLANELRPIKQNIKSAASSISTSMESAASSISTSIEKTMDRKVRIGFDFNLKRIIELSLPSAKIILGP